jgi:hypothetical protein
MPLPRASTFGSFNEQDEACWGMVLRGPNGAKNSAVLKWQMVKDESSCFSRKIDK